MKTVERILGPQFWQWDSLKQQLMQWSCNKSGSKRHTIDMWILRGKYQSRWSNTSTGKRALILICSMGVQSQPGPWLELTNDTCDYNVLVFHKYCASRRSVSKNNIKASMPMQTIPWYMAHVIVHLTEHSANQNMSKFISIKWWKMMNQDSTHKDSLSRIKELAIGSYKRIRTKKFVLSALKHVFRFEESKTDEKTPDNI